MSGKKRNVLIENVFIVKIGPINLVKWRCAMENKSIEQLAEYYSRSICESRGKILDDFAKAYIAHLSKEGDIDIQDICLVEHQCDGPLSFNRKYWFEYKPRFPD